MIKVEIMELHRSKIKLEMEKNGWSPSELARRMGVSRQHVSIFLNKNGGITLKTIDKIADALGLDPKDLIK